MLEHLPQVEHRKLCRIATGTYTGDGTVSQAITGVGFPPKALYIYRQGPGHVHWKTDLDGAWCKELAQGAGNFNYLANRIDSLDADGFTVDDGGADVDPNTTGQTYVFIAWG